MTRTPDPLDPDEAWATPDTFAQCANPGCDCQPTTDPLPREDIE